MRLVLTAFLFIIGFIANAAACDGGDAAVRFGTEETGVGDCGQRCGRSPRMRPGGGRLDEDDLGE